MNAIEPLTPRELAAHCRETRNENRAYARAQERAAADPCRQYRCECGNTATALEIAWWGSDCSCGQWRMAGVQATLTNPLFPPIVVTLDQGQA